ncbi:FecR family protein [Sphingobium yanoikuyae]|uniref:DUF4880 domain-containing protein n=1 Tax=Sphingobium yanoikuyae TaxID=13690 RepID=A0A3G2UTE3_SPHYA|nr:DUF4880 domain-containing protein [Sphingobium yanoikuyae]AYO78205.1 DUF4880 domain-containing protein [Sphingobium yanoikuyae]
MREQGQVGTSLSDQAVAWLVALDCGSADTEAFEDWRNADPRHAAAFAQAAVTWRRTTDPRLPAVLDAPIAIDSAPEDAKAAEKIAPAQPALLSRRAVAGGVGSFLALGGVGLFAAWPRRAYAETAVGERRILRLHDGSQAMLNTDTRVAWRFDDDGRDFWIEHGEAILLVKEATKPFRLYSDAIDGRLSSGKFTLRIDPAGGRLLVLSGQAATISRGTSGRTVDAGSLLTVSKEGDQLERLSPDALSSATAWEHGEIVFQGMALDQAIAEFNRYLKIKLVVQDPALGAIRLGGTFRTADPQSFLVGLNEGFGIGHRQEGDKVLLFRTGRSRGGLRA